MMLLELGYEVAHKILEVPSPVLSSLQHFCVICSFIALIICHNLVGDEGQAQDTQATVTSHHHLRDCAHT